MNCDRNSGLGSKGPNAVSGHCTHTVTQSHTHTQIVSGQKSLIGTFPPFYYFPSFISLFLISTRGALYTVDLLNPTARR